MWPWLVRVRVCENSKKEKLKSIQIMLPTKHDYILPEPELLAHIQTAAIVAEQQVTLVLAADFVPLFDAELQLLHIAHNVFAVRQQAFRLEYSLLRSEPEQQEEQTPSPPSLRVPVETG